VHREKCSNLQFRTTGASIACLSAHRIDPRYKLGRKDFCLTSATGHLELFQIGPLQHGPPAFSALWDQKADTIDIDLDGDTAERRAFKAETGGYRGHHARVASRSPRIYEIDIHTPEGPVFTGKVTLIVDLGLLL
jgi:hypothetical protein